MIRRLTPILAVRAALALVVLGTAVPTAARAQEAPPAAEFVGLAPEAVRQWIGSLGADVGELQRDGGDAYFRVETGGVRWLVFFYGCDLAGLCGDLQYSVAFDAPGVTDAAINAWNRDRRFLKAYLGTAGDGRPLAFAQYDVLIQGGAPPSQLADATRIFLEGVVLFDQHLAAARPAAD